MNSWILLQTHSVIAFIIAVTQIGMFLFLFKSRDNIPVRRWLLLNYFASAIWYIDQMFRFSLYPGTEGSWLYKLETAFIYAPVLILQMLANFQIFYLFIEARFEKERQWVVRLFIPFSLLLFGIFFWNEYYNDSNIDIFQGTSFLWGLISYLLNISISIRKMIAFRHSNREAYRAHLWLTVASLYFITLSVICIIYALYTPVGYWTYFIFIWLGEITLIITYLSFSSVFVSFQIKITGYSFVSVAFFLTVFTLLFFPPTMPEELELRHSQQDGLKKIFILLFAATGLIVLLLPALLRQSLTNPLKKLLRAVKQVNEGNLDVQVPVLYQDEIGSLTNNFNVMTGTLRQTTGRLEEYSQTLNELYINQQKIQEQTLNHVSQEIHDNVGQLLSLVRMQLNLVAEKEGSENRLIADAQENIGRAMMDLRDLAKGMSSERIRVLGLLGSVEQEAERIRRTGACDVLIQQSGQNTSMDHQKETILFRVIQECLQNIIKHAQAKRIQIIFSYKQPTLSIQVADDGKGFLINRDDQLSGLGLMNIRHRIELLKGKLQVQSEPGSGTKIQIEVPIDELG